MRFPRRMLEKLLPTPLHPEFPERAPSPGDALPLEQGHSLSADAPISCNAVSSTASAWDSKLPASHGNLLAQTVVIERHDANLLGRLSKQYALLVCLLIGVCGLWG